MTLLTRVSVCRFYILSLLIVSPVSFSDSSLYEYDATGRLISAQFETRKANYTYDPAGSITVREIEQIVSSGASDFSVSPNLKNFGSVVVGEASSAQSFVISNNSSGSVLISESSVGGADPAEFILTLGTCASLTPAISSGDHCSLTINFRPTSSGFKTASLHIALEDEGIEIILSGMGSESGGGAPSGGGGSASGGQTVSDGITGIVDNSGQRLDGPTIIEGAELNGGVLAGEIENQGTIRDVSLDDNAVITGGTLEGSIIGSLDQPALIRSARIGANTILQNVIIGEDVIVDPGSILGQGVSFLSNENIPAGVNLGTILPTIRNIVGDGSAIFSTINLDQDVVPDEPSILEKIRALDDFQSEGGIALVQNQNGYLELELNGLMLEIAPIAVRQADADFEPGVSITANGEISIISEDGREVLSQPIVRDVNSFILITQEADLGFAFGDNGNLNVLVASADGSNVAFVARAGLNSDSAPDGAVPGISQTVNPLLPGLPLVLFTYEEAGELQQQILFSSPHDWDSLQSGLESSVAVSSVRLDIDGFVALELDGELHRGILDYSIGTSSGPTGSLSFDIIPDANNDGVDDIAITYPDGSRQVMFYLPP